MVRYVLPYLLRNEASLILLWVISLPKFGLFSFSTLGPFFIILAIFFINIWLPFQQFFLEQWICENFFVKIAKLVVERGTESPKICYKFYTRQCNQPVVDVIKLFPKIKKLDKVWSDDWAYTKILKQCYFPLNYIITLFMCSKIAYSCCFGLGYILIF